MRRLTAPERPIHEREIVDLTWTLDEATIAIFENVAQLGQVPPRDFTIVALPTKIGESSGGPLRITALLDG